LAESLCRVRVGPLGESFRNRRADDDEPAEGALGERAVDGLEAARLDERVEVRRGEGWLAQTSCGPRDLVVAEPRTRARLAPPQRLGAAGEGDENRQALLGAGPSGQEHDASKR